MCKFSHQESFCWRTLRLPQFFTWKWKQQGTHKYPPFKFLTCVQPTDAIKWVQTRIALCLRTFMSISRAVKLRPFFKGYVNKRHLRPNSKKVGTGWKIWTLSFLWNPISCCRQNGVVTTSLRNWAFFKIFKIAKKWAHWLIETFFCSFFQISLISRPNRILAWSQLQVTGHKYPKFSY